MCRHRWLVVDQKEVIPIWIEICGERQCGVMLGPGAQVEEYGAFSGAAFPRHVSYGGRRTRLMRDIPNAYT